MSGAGDVTQLLECSPTVHEALGVVKQSCNISACQVTAGASEVQCHLQVLELHQTWSNKQNKNSDVQD